MFHSIDATKTKGRLGQLVNDAPARSANCRMKLLEVNSQPRLCLFAVKDIAVDEELLYDYGVSNLWWRQKVTYGLTFSYFVSAVLDPSIGPCRFRLPNYQMFPLISTNLLILPQADPN